jgi:hypothetical protein
VNRIYTAWFLFIFPFKKGQALPEHTYLSDNLYLLAYTFSGIL